MSIGPCGGFLEAADSQPRLFLHLLQLVQHLLCIGEASELPADAGQFAAGALPQEVGGSILENLPDPVGGFLVLAQLRQAEAEAKPVGTGAA